jgi:hypothetical protein
MDTVKELAGYLSDRENIYLYGAGKYAKRVRAQLQQRGISINGYIVTERGNNPDNIDGKKIWTVRQILDSTMDVRKLTVVVTIKGTPRQLMDDLLDCGLHNMLFPSAKFYQDLALREAQNEYALMQDVYELDMDYPDIEESQAAVIDRKGGRALFRVAKYSGNLAPSLASYCTRESFEEQYGRLELLPHGNAIGLSDGYSNKVEMYVATSHVDQSKSDCPQAGGYIPIQVGAALTNVRKGCITDAAGDNISDQNKNYCECTGLYWIWKNTSGQDFVGLSHYRRRLMLDDVSMRYVREHGINAVVPLPQFCVQNIEEFFAQFISRHDWMYLREAVLEYDASYKTIFWEHEKSHFYFPCNVCLLERGWFDRYCEFAFDIASRVGRRYGEKGIFRDDRYMGYLFENLFSIFVKRYYREMRVACSEIEWIR